MSKTHILLVPALVLALTGNPVLGQSQPNAPRPGSPGPTNPQDQVPTPGNPNSGPGRNNRRPGPANPDGLPTPVPNTPQPGQPNTPNAPNGPTTPRTPNSPGGNPAPGNVPGIPQPK